LIHVKPASAARIIFSAISVSLSKSIVQRNSIVSVQQAAAVLFPREEALLIASLLALTGGYLDAYTWIVHRAFANAQTANLVFLWVYLTGGEWSKALHYVPPLFAFVFGVIMASCLRKFAPGKAPEISVVTEIVFLFVIAILHNRLPGVAGTLGLFPSSPLSRRQASRRWKDGITAPSWRRAIFATPSKACSPLFQEARRRNRFAGLTCSAQCASLLESEPPLARS
jgi:Protein of unknown function (DUF1275)